jgi:hypothetical protein
MIRYIEPDSSKPRRADRYEQGLDSLMAFAQVIETGFDQFSARQTILHGFSLL